MKEEEQQGSIAIGSDYSDMCDWDYFCGQLGEERLKQNRENTPSFKF